MVYVDADWGGDTVDRKSTSGSLVQIGGCYVFWKSTMQNSVALSTTEAEYIAMSEACKNAVWIRALLVELGEKLDGPTPRFEDNQGAIVWG